MQIHSSLRGLRRLQALTTSACVLRQKSTEPHYLYNTEVMEVPLSPLPVSTFPPIMKLEARPKRVLLLTSETAFEAEVRDALRIRQHEGDSAVFFELSYLLLDFLAVLDLLDLVRQSFFRYDTYRAFSFYLVSRTPLPSGRSTPSPFKVFTVGSLITLLGRFREDPPRQQIIAWVAEQALHCPSKMVGVSHIP